MKRGARSATTVVIQRAEIMTIYTKTGDKGTTALFGGKRVSKYDQQIKAYGNIDELSSFIGLIISKDIKDSDKEFLSAIQRNLYIAMSMLCSAPVNLDGVSAHVSEMEKYIDEQEKNLPELKKFILPQGTETSVWFHVLRTVCRRAERSVVGFLNNNSLIKTSQKNVVLEYLNRMSDLFFIMARKYNKGKEIVT